MQKRKKSEVIGAKEKSRRVFVGPGWQTTLEGGW